MPLQAIIIRADGALAETDEVQRKAMNRVFSEAGFDWQCDRANFAELRKTACDKGLVTHFVTGRLRAQLEDDRAKLIEAMCRRVTTIYRELLDAHTADVREGMRELASAAKREGVKIALATTRPREDAKRLLDAAFGANWPDLFTAVAANDDPAHAHAPAEIYHRALRQLGLDAADCLAIEATAAGLGAATAAGLPTLVTRSMFAAHDDLDAALFVVEDLPSLIAPSFKNGTYVLRPEHGREILSALQQLHAGNLDVFGNLHRSTVMKVSDILKSKGSTVKTIRSTETIRALAQKLRTDGVGAMVVTGTSGSLDGIISERDIAYGLGVHGADLPSMLVSDLMTRAVVTCAPEDSIAGVAKIMTQRRFRHLPVQSEGQLVGLISIGDVLKHRLEEVQLEASVLRDYAIAVR